MTLLIHILIGIGVVGGAVYIAQLASVPQPIKIVLWVVAFLVFLIIFLPLAGVRLPA